MSNDAALTLRWRGLLTETLPYEVPVIFSNDLLYASLVKPSAVPSIGRLVGAMRSKLARFSIPYTYRIAKDDARFTSLSIIHPNHQLNINDFYEIYRQSILDYCGKSEATLRRPISEMGVFSAHPLDEEETRRQGVPHILPEDGEIDVSRMTSYFTYGRYNLLGKFIDSAEYRSLEKKFGYLRTLDISKCFFNIYTHSITWAVKGKAFSKTQTDVYSFESSFDRLMQVSNYNETNGIVVGPEVSRIFAEIILQDVDRRVISGMLPAVHNVDYSLRRYVDDFFIFAPNTLVLDKVMMILEKELEFYKLFINAEKTDTVIRPFVSPITLARSELRSLISGMHSRLDVLTQNFDVNAIRKAARELRQLALDIRLISKRHSVSFSTISGWLLATLRTLLLRSIAMIRMVPTDEERSALADMAVAILEIAFYIGALDIRVRTTYSLCQIVGVLDSLKEAEFSDVSDRLMHSIGEELSGMIISLLGARSLESLSEHPTMFPSRSGDDYVDDCVELYNLIITGAHFVGANFLKLPAVKRALRVISHRPATYFSYITLKFCFLKNRGEYAVELSALNQAIRSMVIDGKNMIDLNSEIYLIACDYLSAPDISASEKRTMISAICGGNPSNADSVIAGQYLGFVDWFGVRISHVLARKQLRPVYSWS